MFIYIFSINLLACQLFVSVQNIKNAVQHVIKRAEITGHRSVLLFPMVGSKSSALNNIVEEAVNKSIVVVTSAGKNQLHNIAITTQYH